MTVSLPLQSPERHAAHLLDVSTSPKHDNVAELPPAPPILTEGHDGKQKVSVRSLISTVCDAPQINVVDFLPRFKTQDPVQIKVSEGLLDLLELSGTALRSTKLQNTPTIEAFTFLHVYANKLL